MTALTDMIRGRQTVLNLTNQSGGGVIAGDVVIVDTGHDESFTTTTSANYTGELGVVLDASIAAAAAGRVLVAGYVPLINVNASVTRGHYGATYTVAKEASDAGASRTVGTFCQFLKGGATPSAVIWPVDLLGSSLTNPMSAVGDIIQGTTGGAPAKLAAPAAGEVLTSAGVTTPLVYAFPPGHQFDYAEETTGAISCPIVAESSAATIVSGASVTYDGSTVVSIEFYAPFVAPNGVSEMHLCLFDGSSSLGRMGGGFQGVAGDFRWPVYLVRQVTPSAGVHTYSIRGFSVGGPAGEVEAGAGGSGALMPAFMRITKV